MIARSLANTPPSASASVSADKSSYLIPDKPHLGTGIPLLGASQPQQTSVAMPNSSKPLIDSPDPADTLLMAALSKLQQLTLSGPPTWNTTLKFVFIVLALVNLKSLPLTWHFRFYRSLFHHLLHRRSVDPKPSDLFSPVSTTSRSPLYECDLNFHKSNSTYFSDLDIARTHLICHVFKRSLRARRGLYVALAGVSCLFRREIKPFEKYEVVSRVLGWDGKWVWVVSHFVALKPEKGERKIFASALSKYVFKQGRITVKPAEILRECELLPERPKAVKNGHEKVHGEVAVVGPSEKELMKQLDEGKKPDEYWTWERIEAERQRGCEIAQYMLGLDQLEGEIRNGEEEGLTHVGNFY